MESNVNESHLRSLETGIVEEINSIRENPSAYIEKLETDLTYIKDNVIHRPGEDAIRLKEGDLAFKEAIEFLKKQDPVDKLVLDDRLSHACRDHCDNLGAKGLFSNEGSDNKTVFDRLNAYCEWDYTCHQNIDFGSRNARELLVSLLTCDGDSTRTYRAHLFSNNVHFIGVASNTHKESGVCTALCYVGNVRDLGSESPECADFVKNHMENKNIVPKRIKNSFQIDDPDAPDNAISFTTLKSVKLVNGRAKRCVQKVYTLTDGTKHINELLEDIKIYKKK